MLEFYQKVFECSPDAQNMAAVVLNGPFFGQRALFSEGKLVWESRPGSFFTEHGPALWTAALLGGDGPKKVAEVSGAPVFCDWLGQEMHLVVCGGGHVSIPVIQIGRMLGFCVTVLEDCPKFAGHARRAGATEVLCGPFEEGLKKVPGGDNTYFVIVTRGHRYDQVCLELAIKKKHAYIGMIGSQRRVAVVKGQIGGTLKEKAALERLYSPIGLDIGAETPEEVGVSIMAEIIEVKNRKKKGCGYPPELLREILNPGVRGSGKQVLATIVSRRGSAPREAGAKMLIRPDGSCLGTIGGGCMESEVIRQALYMIQKGAKEGKIYHVDMAVEDAQEEGMVCGGEVDMLLEVISY